MILILNSITCAIMIAVMYAATQQMARYDISIWRSIFKCDYVSLIDLPKQGAYVWYALLRFGLLINILSLIPNIVHKNIILYATPIIWISIFFIIKKSEHGRTYNT